LRFYRREKQKNPNRISVKLYGGKIQSAHKVFPEKSKISPVKFTHRRNPH